MAKNWMTDPAKSKGPARSKLGMPADEKAAGKKPGAKKPGKVGKVMRGGKK